LSAQKFTEIAGKYRLRALSAIGDITVVNENEYLVIERDKLQEMRLNSRRFSRSTYRSKAMMATWPKKRSWISKYQ